MSNYKCESCGKYRKPEKQQFAIGDDVQFATQIRYPSGNISATARQGVVIDRQQTTDGEWAVRVKMKRIKDRPWVSEAHCVPGDAPGPLSYAMVGTCSCEVANEAD